MSRRCAIRIVALMLSTGLLQAQWLDALPSEYAGAVLWAGDHEEVSLYDWDYPDFLYAGGGIFNTGPPNEAEAAASSTVAHSGLASARATIRNAFQATNGSRAVRLMRWTERPWDDGGAYFPERAYFSTWMYFPHTYNPNKYAPWDPGDGGWWNVFQFKSDDADDVSQPIFTLNVDHDDTTGSMEFYLYTKVNTPASYGQPSPVAIPVQQWVHVEALYEQSADGRGRIAVWQDGRLILNVAPVNTVLAGNAVWGIGNYTDHIVGGPVPGEAELYFDDAAVATRRLSGAAAPPISPVADGRGPEAGMRASRGAGGDPLVELSFDTSGCGATYHLVHGTGPTLPTFGYAGAVCDLGPSGVDTVPIPTPPPGELVWWVLTAADGGTEGHHGTLSSGLVRPAQAIGFCGLTAQSTATCS